MLNVYDEPTIDFIRMWNEFPKTIDRNEPRHKMKGIHPSYDLSGYIPYHTEFLEKS